MSSFKEKFNALKEKTNLCVGLDPDLAKLPAHLSKEPAAILEFNKAIIDATAEYTCAYKPNIAFYEQYGLAGLEVLQKTINYVPNTIPIILDAKRGDIGNTAKAYAKAAFEDMQADAITLAPYMGRDSITPFLEYQEKYAFVLCLTSNAGSVDFQKPELYLKVANKIVNWNQEFGNCGLVAGATQGDELKKIRALSDDTIFLIPGIGAQGGDLETTLNYVKGSQNNFLINSSRAIIYADNGTNFAKQAGIEAKKLQESILAAR